MNGGQCDTGLFEKDYEILLDFLQPPEPLHKLASMWDNNLPSSQLWICNSNSFSVCLLCYFILMKSLQHVGFHHEGDDNSSTYCELFSLKLWVMTTLVMFLKSVVTDFFSLQISYMFDSWYVIILVWGSSRFSIYGVGLQQRRFVAEDELTEHKDLSSDCNHTCPEISTISHIWIRCLLFRKCGRTADFLYTHTPSLYTSHLQRKL